MRQRAGRKTTSSIVMCDDNVRRFLGFDKGNTMVQVILDEEGLLRVLQRKYKLEHTKKNSD